MSAQQNPWPPGGTLAFKLVPAVSPDDAAVRFSQADNCTTVWVTLFPPVPPVSPEQLAESGATPEQLAEAGVSPEQLADLAAAMAELAEKGRRIEAKLNRRPDAAPVRAVIAESVADAAQGQGHELTEEETILLARFAAGDAGPDFWRTARVYGLLYVPAEEVQVPVSPRTQALARRFDRLAIEHTVARSPVSLTIKDKPASAAHKMIVNFWTKRYAERGCPSDGVVAVSFTEWGQLFGYPDDMGGGYYEIIRDWLRDFRSAGISEEWLQKGHRGELWFAIIQGYGVTEKDGMTYVQLSAALQTSIRHGAWSYLNQETWLQLHQASPHSDVAELLWMWLETETLPFRWRIFAAPEGKSPKRGDVRCVAERLNLHNARRRDAVATIRRAARVVMDVCPWYQIRVENAAGVGMWNLVADRQAAIGTDAPTRDARRTNGRRGDAPTDDAETHQRTTRGLPDDGKKVLHARKENDDLRISSPSCFLPFCFLPFLKAQDGGENAAAQESKTEEETVDWLRAFPEAIRGDEELWQLLVAVLGDHTAALFRTAKRGHAATVKRLLGDVCAFLGQAMGAVDCETRRPACRAAALYVLGRLAEADEPIKLAQSMLNTANGLGSYVPEDLIERCRMIDRSAPVSDFAKSLGATLAAATPQDASLEVDDG